MTSLQTIFPSLTLFSDIDWEAVTREYESEYIDISFPEYLQQKALEGDCPPYLFELAFYELALFEIRNSTEKFPHQPGIYLNPTSLFLSLEFDVGRMMEEAHKGEPVIIEREHVLSIYRDKNDTIHTLPLTEEELSILELLEEGPQADHTFLKDSSPIIFQDLVRKGLILDLSK